jgi:MFS family permease
MIGSALLDLRPVREVAAFRRLWVGTTASAFGGQMSAYAVLFYVWERTHSPAMVGVAGLATAAPLIVFALLGSAFADHVDRRTLLLWTTWAQVVVAAAMAALAAVGGGAWPLLGLVAASSGLSAITGPARRALVPALLPQSRLAAGLALNHLSFQAAMLLGPVVAGVVTAMWGVEVCFAVDAVSFLAALWGIAGLPAGQRTAAPTGNRGVRAVVEGVRLTVRVPAIGGALLTDLVATVLAMPIALFPVLNEEKFDGDPQTLGWLLAAVAVGGVAASALSGVITRRDSAGRVLLACAATWGVALAGVALTDQLVVVLGLLAIAGAADTWSVVSRGTVVQAETPEEFRGRVAALEHVVGAAGPHVGGFRAGLVAGASSGSVAMLVGGVSCLVGVAAIAARCRALRTFRVRHEEPAPARV